MQLLALLLLLAAPAVCRPGSEDCALGQFCEDPQGTGRGVCRPSCDASSERARCAPGAVCRPFVAPSRFGSAPGTCHDEVCVPGREAAICGYAASCALAPPVSLCQPAGNAGPGAPCAGLVPGSASPCRPGLVCFEGRCATPCNANACAADARCFDLSAFVAGDDRYALCDPGCDPIAQRGCAPGQTCVARSPSPDGRWLGACEAAVPGRVPPGGHCRPAQDEGVLEGDCEPGSVCMGSREEAECVALCDAVDHHRCGSGAVCGHWGASLGSYCYGDCDPRRPGACGSGRVCRLQHERGPDATGVVRQSGRCVAVDHPLPEGSHCRRHDGVDRCGEGLLCFGEPPDDWCVRACDLRPGQRACAQGFECWETESVNPLGRELSGWCLPQASFSPR